ncbi:MAG: hypothetical protein MUE55_04835 [Thermoplasmata archaeon]|jgi:epoxyqueuosine reductase|nr:hypothetical protein [Thermoplasmata archaeon]
MEGAELLTELARKGIRARLVSLEDVESVREDVRALHREGAVDDGLYKEWIRRYVDHPLPKDVRKAKSVLVYSRPSLPLTVGFAWKGGTVELVVPPTYHDYWESMSAVRGTVREFAGRDCYIAKAVLPLKLLSARSGIVRYGRNNITYVEGNGSFHRLGAIYTSIEPDGEGLVPPMALPKCRTCRACVKACPTGAVCGDRFLVRAEKCLTRFNERTADRPFPRWISPSWHNSLLGCMKCQLVCPYNGGVLERRKDGVSFSEAETSYLLKGAFRGEKAKTMGRKLRRAGVDPALLPRNLAVMLRNEHQQQNDRR